MTISLELEKKLRRAKEVFRTRSLEEAMEAALDFALKQAREPIPAAVRHQVYLRDQGKCQFQNCNETHWIELHHKKPVSHGGRNSVENLTTLCAAHHGYIHQLQGA